MTLRTLVCAGGSSVSRISGRSEFGSCQGREVEQKLFQSMRPGRDMLMPADHHDAVRQAAPPARIRAAHRPPRGHCGTASWVKMSSG